MTSCIHKIVEHVGQIGALAIFLGVLWAIAEVCARAAVAWRRRRKSRVPALTVVGEGLTKKERQ